MANDGSIIILEDDKDDEEILVEIFKSINVNNELIFFNNARDALNFLAKTDKQPFLILSDINLPDMDGLTFKEKIECNELLRKKSIPFVFISTSAAQTMVERAYDLTIQGFFKKPNSYKELETKIKLIVDYWMDCIHPNSF